MSGNDRLAIINADGSFANAVVNEYIANVAQQAAEDAANDTTGTVAVEPNTLVRRDGDGRASAAAPTQVWHVATKGYVDTALEDVPTEVTSPPVLYADSPTTVPARATVVPAGYTGPVIVHIGQYPRSAALDAAALAVMQDNDELIRRIS